MLRFDHVLIAVSDLTEAAARLEREHGLASLEGGKHTGLGTGNRIVPMGRDYLELIAVVEPAIDSPLSRWVSTLCRDRDRPAALCLATDDIEAVSGPLGLSVMAMQRERPDGVVLSWKLAGLEDTLADPSLPFFIQWLVDPVDHPGATEVDHDSSPEGIAWVEIAGDRAVLGDRLVGAGELDIRVVEGEPGVRSVGLSTSTGTVVIS